MCILARNLDFLDLRTKKDRKFARKMATFSTVVPPNKASVPKLQKFVEISDIDGASNFAPKIITQKTYCQTRILNLL